MKLVVNCFVLTAVCLVGVALAEPARAQNWSLYEPPEEVKANLRELVAGCMRGDIRDLEAIEASCAEAITTIEQFKEQSALSDRAVETQSRVRRLRLQRASVLLEMGIYKTAFKELLKADDPADEGDDAVLDFMKSVALVGGGVTGRFDPAFTYLKRAITAPSAEIQFYALLVRTEALTSLGAYNDAFADLEAARLMLVENQMADAARKRAELNLYRGYLLLDTGNARAAFDLFDKAVTLLPSDADPYAARGLSHARLGAREKAIADYSKAIATGHGFDPVARQRLAWLLASDPRALDDGAKAVDLAEEVIAIRKKTEQPRTRFAVDQYILATAQRAAGEAGKAVASFSDALDADPRLSQQFSRSLDRFGLLPAGGARNPADMLAAIRACVGLERCRIEVTQWCGDLADVPCIRARR